MFNNIMLCGTSGYHYLFWGPCPQYEECGISNFYSFKLSKTEWLKEYSKTLKSVEINCTRYKKLTPKMCKNWVKSVPKDFKFKIKASLYITHSKKLKDFKEWWEEFEKCILEFGSQFECVLFQFHTSFAKNDKNISKLKNVKKIIPKNIKCAFEFRNADWYSSKAIKSKRLNKLFKDNWTQAIIDVPPGDGLGTLSEGVNIGITNSKFVYIRCHGTTKYCSGTYSRDKLQMLKDIAYFNNTDTWTVSPFMELEANYGGGNLIPMGTHLTPSAIYNAIMMQNL